MGVCEVNLIIVPVVVGRNMTKRCIKSLLAQDIGDVHVIVIDNGSEHCSAMLRAMQTLQMSIVTNVTRQGLNQVWNKMLGYAFDKQHLPHVLVVNNDTVLREDTYRMLRDDGGLFVTAVGQDGPVDQTDRMTLEELQQKRRPHPDFSCFLIRRECWDRIGQFNPEINAYCGDADYHLRMHRAGVEASSLPIPFEHVASGTLKQASIPLRDQILKEADADRAIFRRLYGCAVGDEAYYAMFKEPR